jgi:hypothetical protein
MNRLFFIVSLGVLTATPAIAQEPKAEVGVFAGWVFSSGISGNNFLAPDGNVYNTVDPKSSFGWGFDVGFFIGGNAEVGFIYSHQASTLEVSGTATKEVGPMGINTYHGYFAYNWGPADGKIRPYLLGGLGATSFGDTSYTSITGASKTVSGVSRFSSTWGGGVKIYGARNVGGRVGFHWNPTYITSTTTGWWCDPYWGCYLVGNAKYANQFALDGGVTFRF